jgi:hypothetical protein
MGVELLITSISQASNSAVIAIAKWLVAALFV